MKTLPISMTGMSFFHIKVWRYRNKMVILPTILKGEVVEEDHIDGSHLIKKKINEIALEIEEKGEL